MRAARAVVRKGRRSQCGSRAIAPPWRCYSLSLLCALAEQQQRAKHYFRERGADEALPSGVRVCRSIRAAVFVITFQLRDSADRRHIEHVHLFFSLCKYSTKPPRMIRSQTFESVLANTFVRLARSLAHVCERTWLLCRVRSWLARWLPSHADFERVQSSVRAAADACVRAGVTGCPDHNYIAFSMSANMRGRATREQTL